MVKRGGERSKGVQSVDRAVSVLYVLAEARQALSLNEISLRTELDKATVHRLLTTLVDRHLVEAAGGRGRYGLGWGVLRLEAGLIGGSDLKQIARPHLERL